MLKFRCPTCSQKLSVQDDRAGRGARCPKCKTKIRIPCPPVPQKATVEEELRLIPVDNPSAEARPNLDRHVEMMTTLAPSRPPDEAPPISPFAPPPPENTGRRALLWPIDILLYPMNLSGMVSLIAIVGIPTVFNLVLGFLPLFGVLTGILLLLANLFVALYAGWYLAECVYDSAKGGTRAPESSIANMGDMWSRVLYLALVYVFFFAPIFFYALFARRADWIFWGLVTWAIVVFPMGLLAMVMLDSISVLNPVFLLGSIARTFVPYIGQLIALVLLMILLGWLGNILTSRGPFLLRVILAALFCYYTSMVLAHALGRFYWRYEERLDWGA